MWQSTAYEQRRLKLMASFAEGKILDLGYAQLPNTYLPKNCTTGLDLCLPLVPTGYSEELLGSALDLKNVFQDRRFDTVLAGEIIEHVEEPYKFLRDVREVIKDGGKLVLSTPNPLGFPVLLAEVVRSKRWFYTSDHTYYFLPRWVNRLLSTSGFNLIRTRAVGIWLPYGCVPWSPVSASYQLIYVAEAC